MNLRIVAADVLTTDGAEAIFLPIDGQLPPKASGAQVARSFGRIAREFARRHPDIELADEVEAQVDFPLAPGGVAEVELGAASPYRWALLLSMLPHQQAELAPRTLRAAVSASLSGAVQRCATLAVRGARTPLLTGGWRLPPFEAMSLMLAVLADPALGRTELDLSVCLFGDEAVGSAAKMRDLARGLGFAVD